MDLARGGLPPTQIKMTRGWGLDRWIDGDEGEAEVTAMERFMCAVFACGRLVGGWVWVLCLLVYICMCE